MNGLFAASADRFHPDRPLCRAPHTLGLALLSLRPAAFCPAPLLQTRARTYACYTPGVKNQHSSRLLGSLLFALAIIASAWILHGTPASLWVETALTGAALSFFILQRPVCSSRPR